MQLILLSTFILKDGLAKVTLPCFRTIIFFGLKRYWNQRAQYFWLSFFCMAYAMIFPPWKQGISRGTCKNIYFVFFRFEFNISNISKCEICGLGSLKVGENGSLWYAISLFNKSRYEEIRYLLLIKRAPNESKELLSSYYQYSFNMHFKTMEDGQSFY